MGLFDDISKEIKEAMLAKDKERLMALRDIKSKLLLEATSGGGEVTDKIAAKIIMKLHKQRMDTHELYKKEGREDLAAEEKAQADVIAKFLPEMMSEEDIRQEVEKTIKDVGAEAPKDMGKVMGVLTKKLAGKADGKLIAQIVKDTLAK